MKADRMTHRWHWTAAVLIALSALLSGPAGAEQKQAFGDYEVHYIAMPTAELAPAVARAYGVKRSRSRGIVVLNVQHREQPFVGVPAQVSGLVRNLIGQIKTRELREFREQDAIYSIAEFGFSNLETLVFRFDIRPPGQDESYRLEFNQQFYVNPD